MFLTRLSSYGAKSVRVASVRWCTRASGGVIDHSTLGILAASPQTRINAFGSRTSSIGGTIGVHGALGSASSGWVTDVVGHAGARADVVAFLANCVWSAGRWDTGIHNYWILH